MTLDHSGWQRQAESSELGDSGLPVRRLLAEGHALDNATPGKNAGTGRVIGLYFGRVGVHSTPYTAKTSNDQYGDLGYGGTL
jgi:hypothetical protein